MDTFDWDDVRVFLAIVEHGTLAIAAEQIGVNQSTISRRISALEDRLDSRLFERHRGSRWVLTNAGEQMLHSAETMNDSANAIAQDVMRNATELSGEVSVTFTEHGARFFALPALAAIAREFPDLRLQIQISNDPLNLSAREADVAVRIGDEMPADVVGKRICSVAVSIYASPEMLTRIADGQSRVPLLGWEEEGPISDWALQLIPRSYVAYRTNSSEAIRGLARLGIGVAPMSCIEGNNTEGVEPVPGVPVIEGPGIWVLSHADVRTTARVRLVRDRLVDVLTEAREQLAGPFASTPQQRQSDRFAKIKH
ncbi:MAG: LysR family transcriptional regulator [Pseudomonadota bacterium]